MPLAALVNGERRIACLLDSETWAALRRSRPCVILTCCGQTGFLRKSKLGTQHFVHSSKSNFCASAPESERHLRLKSVIAQAATEAGWSADVEVANTSGAWRADVLAARGNAKVAFEVQLAPIQREDLLARHERYRGDGVRGCWFYGSKALSGSLRDSMADPMRAHPDPLHIRMSEEPIFECDDADSIRIGNEIIPIATAVQSLCKGEFKFCRQQRIKQSKSIRIFRFSKCRGCGKDFHIYLLFTTEQNCQSEFECPCQYQDILSASSSPWIEKKVRSYIASRPDITWMLSIPAWQTWVEYGESYRYGFCCFHCNVVSGREIFEQILEYGFYSYDNSFMLEEVAKIPVASSSPLVDRPHWCFSKERTFCT